MVHSKGPYDDPIGSKHVADLQCTGLFEMIVGVLTTCHTQYI